MNEKQVIDALKGLIKQQGKTYKDVAQWLDLSEGSVKRLFAKGDIRLDRLLCILNQLGRDMNDLVSVIHSNSRQISQITIEQERELVEDLPTLLVSVAVLSQLSIEEIVEYYSFPEELVEKALLKLDKMNIIQLMPKNYYQLNVNINFRWLHGGPIQTFFMENLAANYMSSPLESNDRLLMLGAMLSEHSNERLEELIEDFMLRFQELNLIDRPLPVNAKTNTFVVLAKRHDWYKGKDINGDDIF